MTLKFVFVSGRPRDPASVPKRRFPPRPVE